jgi:peptide chain release factor 1
MITSDICYIEVRGGTGGDEAKNWANDLLRMYLRYCQKVNLKVTPIDEGVIKVKGTSVFDIFKNESGVHRVQRVPDTERKGRIHTSTATVAVLPEISDRDIIIRPEDLDIQFFRAGGHGGQNVNKVSTAVRLTHKPSGIVVTAQTERFQEQNRINAMNLLRTKLWEREEEEKMKTVANYRSAVGSGKRSEKIRTYNFPQDRITDHRINKSFGNIEAIIDGSLEKVLETTKSL